MEPKFKTREEVLQDAIDYFWGKPERKCVNHDGICSYTPIGESEGCAIGRLIPIEIAKKLRYAVYEIGTFNLLPSWLKDMGYQFLVELQRCHDMSAFADMKKKRVARHMSAYVDMGKITFPN